LILLIAPLSISPSRPRAGTRCNVVASRNGSQGEDYAKVGQAAAYHCQIESLGLMPWMSPPCYPTMSALDQPYGDVGAKKEIAELALRMQRCGVNRWHPDPARECDRVEAEQRQIAK
jgi:hypothetical protein